MPAGSTFADVRRQPMPSRRAAPSWILHALVIAEVAIALLAIRNWFYVTTYRFYLDQRVSGTHDVRQSTAAQRFDVEGRHVVPQIAARERDRIGFQAAVGRPSTLHVDVRPGSNASGDASNTIARARYEIRLREGGVDRRLASGDTAVPVSVACPLPSGVGTVELINDSSLTWVDPRLVRDFEMRPHAAALALLLAASMWLARTRPERLPAPAPTPVTWLRAGACCVSIVMTVGMVEGGLWLLGDRVPAGIAAERHDLGEVSRDPRWEDSPRYERRLRARVDAINEWKYGDIVRMGYVPAAVSDGIVHRFRFQTDADGFRNASVRDRFDVAALGDSFTDAMTLPAAESWPAQLERRLGMTVQNYGTAGFGPQQELLVLKDYISRHRPRVVVLAFFAGNDLFDAEAFDDFERSDGAIRRAVPGWRIKDVFSRADTTFVVSALRAASTWVSRQSSTPGVAAEGLERGSQDSRGSQGSSPVSAVFDRGMFSVPVNGGLLRCALMPPYLNTLTFSEQDLGGRRGWALTRQTLAEMQRQTQAFGGTFVVVFVPFKSQVYFPLLRRTFSPEQLQSAFQFYLGASPNAPDLDAMFRNRLAQNALMRRFCDATGIPLLDLTDALQTRVEAGENMYFPDESHLNEAGHALVADSLAGFLRRR